MNSLSNQDNSQDRERRELLKTLLGEKKYSSLTEWQIMCEYAALQAHLHNQKESGSLLWMLGL